MKSPGFFIALNFFSPRRNKSSGSPKAPISPISRRRIFHQFSSSRRKPGSSVWDGCRRKFYGLDPGFRRDDGFREDLGGFTLIELVLSLALAAVLAAVLGGVLRGAVGTWRDMRDTSRARQRAQALYDRLGRDLRNGLSFPGETFKGSSEELVFKTVVEVPSIADSIETSPRIARVSYQRETTPDGNALVLDQQIYSTVPLAETQNQQTTIPAEVKFSFAYSGGSEGQVLWEDVWIDTGTFPRGIKAELTFPNKKGPLRYETAFHIPQGAFPLWNR